MSEPPGPLLTKLLLQLGLQVFLIFVNAFFACAEIALISLNTAKLTKRADEGSKAAKRLLFLTAAPEKFLATIQVGITFAGFLGSAFAANSFSQMISSGLQSLLQRIKINVGMEALNSLSVVLITIILSFLTLVLGELLPKRLAMKKSEKLAYAMSGFLVVVSKIFLPLVSLLSGATNGLLRLLGIDPNAADSKVTEEDIRLLVDSGSESGAIHETEGELIHNIFEFNDKTLSDVMVHRSNTQLLWLKDDDDVWEKLILETGFRHYPVCGETFDDIIGVLAVRDYLLLDKSERVRDNVMKNAVKPAFFVPETQKTNVLFLKMKSTHEHFAVVLDEYGGNSGIVTLSDLLEAIVGEL